MGLSSSFGADRARLRGVSEVESPPPPPLRTPSIDVELVAGLAPPSEFYWVSRGPVPIAGMRFPALVDWPALHALGVTRIVCLTHGAPPYDPSPLEIACFNLEDLWGKAGPGDEPAELALIQRAADAVVNNVRAGEGTVVHCRGGRGRTGTVLGVALVRLGHDPPTVVAWLQRLHRARSSGSWPESPWQETVVRAAVPDAPPART
jgi:hypothetical protein